jgi:hypothetical protein
MLADGRDTDRAADFDAVREAQRRRLSREEGFSLLLELLRTVEQLRSPGPGARREPADAGIWLL